MGNGPLLPSGAGPWPLLALVLGALQFLGWLVILWAAICYLRDRRRRGSDPGVERSAVTTRAPGREGPA